MIISSQTHPQTVVSQGAKTTLTLVADNFQILYFSKRDADHSINALEDKYGMKIDWEGAKYIGINFKWDYKKDEVILLIKGYVE